MKLIKGLSLCLGVVLSTQSLAVCYGSPDNMACNSQNEDEMRRANNGYYDNSSDSSAYIPPTVITLPDSWGAIALGSKAIGIASKQASKQASKPPC